MNVILDTHVVLWWLADSRELGVRAREIIASPTNTVFLSAVVVWETRIKQGLGKLNVPSDFAAVLEQQAFEKLPISIAHAHEVHALPSHHRDPFDRMLIAQAKVEGLTLVTRDPIIAQYAVACELA
ncbi:MAG: type II toxin-antitoxin system VapC family toxin [Clostridia bacterium]|nr:type II toxin-antitoxin system VapC family toxin [Deltaproteobacteria bacterium]